VILFQKKCLNAEYKRIQPQTQRGISRLNRNPNTQVMEFRSADFGFLIWKPLEIQKSGTWKGLKFGPSYSS